MNKEEALNTLMKMRAWRAWGKEQKEEERPEMPEQKEVDEAFDVCIELLQQPPLPSNLDEAAKRYGTEKHPMTTIGANESAYDFKAGAEWMAKQGITVTGDTDDEYIRILEDVEEAICKIAPDSTINVQIRK